MRRNTSLSPGIKSTTSAFLIAFVVMVLFAMSWTAIRCFKKRCVFGVQKTTELHEVMLRGDHDRAVELIQSGLYDLNTVAEEDCLEHTPLVLAVGHDWADVVALLLKKGADPNQCCGSQFDTPLGFVCGMYGFRGRRSAHADQKKIEIVKLLLEAGADMALAAGDGLRPWDRYSMIEISKVLLDAGADINGRRWPKNYPKHLKKHEKREQGNTKLHEATFRLDVEMISFLLNKGAKTDLTNDEGLTPLAYMVKYAYYDQATWRRIGDMFLNHGSSAKIDELIKKYPDSNQRQTFRW